MQIQNKKERISKFIDDEVNLSSDNSDDSDEQIIGSNNKYGWSQISN